MRFLLTLVVVSMGVLVSRAEAEEPWDWDDRPANLPPRDSSPDYIMCDMAPKEGVIGYRNAAGYHVTIAGIRPSLIQPRASFETRVLESAESL